MSDRTQTIETPELSDLHRLRVAIEYRGPWDSRKRESTVIATHQVTAFGKAEAQCWRDLGQTLGSVLESAGSPFPILSLAQALIYLAAMNNDPKLSDTETALIQAAQTVVDEHEAQVMAEQEQEDPERWDGMS